MGTGLERLGQILVDASLATAVFLSLIILLMLLCRQPARRIIVARVAIVATFFLLPVVATYAIVGPEIPVRLIERVAGIAPEPDASPAPTATPPGDRPGVLSPPGDDPRPRTWPLQLVAVAYLGGVAIGLGWSGLGAWGIHRRLRESVEPSPATLALEESLLHRMGERGPPPAIRVSTYLDRPVLVGLRRPTVFIPTHYDEIDFDGESLRIILLHELAHARQSDTWSNVAATLAQSLWFFLPFVWWVRVQLRIDQEFLADQRVSLLTGSPAGYATRLVALAAQQGASAVARPGVPLPLPSRPGERGRDPLSPLLQRVLMLLHSPFPVEPGAPRWWELLAPWIVAGLAALSIGLTFSMLGRWPSPGRPASPASLQRTFQVREFVATPRTGKPLGRDPFYVLPLPLPADFELRVDVQASRPALTRLRFNGLPLASPPPDAAATVPASSDPPAIPPGPEPLDVAEPPKASVPWHRVRMARKDGRVSLFVDDELQPVDPAIPLTPRLSIEPATEETTIFRNLLVTW